MLIHTQRRGKAAQVWVCPWRWCGGGLDVTLVIHVVLFCLSSEFLDGHAVCVFMRPGWRCRLDFIILDLLSFLLKTTFIRRQFDTRRFITVPFLCKIYRLDLTPKKDGGKKLSPGGDKTFSLNLKRLNNLQSDLESSTMSPAIDISYIVGHNVSSGQERLVHRLVPAHWTDQPINFFVW